MNTQDRKAWSKKLEKWGPYFMIVCTLIGAGLGSFLAYLFLGEFPYEVLAGGLAAAIILTVIQLIKQKRKKDHLPEADERVVHNIFRFFAYASHMTLAILFIGLAVFTLLGYESIPMLYVWILFFAYIWIAGWARLWLREGEETPIWIRSARFHIFFLACSVTSYVNLNVYDHSGRHINGT